ncbi:S-adenosyl-L-methionine-dependent tRNA 4-demethylwyosine synthase TYW1-like isoform X2 [Macrosteles quadrilineatus]|uniref:S-adenosyl-L-methionine-dependent tRNA 4-demethylwyosine synthase TYW1-like isoform X2 n=1 Tax=Macrosteles quadrilineatus TaxID=74068 RepID=UPI0023E1C3EA|nr:S-adenosyl-L-methionine-dependent tRNA 4-demethylwyosine synthase TYW1-like isoform X2 [Macrosteles quadrilineatus]
MISLLTPALEFLYEVYPFIIYFSLTLTSLSISIFVYFKTLPKKQEWLHDEDKGEKSSKKVSKKVYTKESQKLKDSNKKSKKSKTFKVPKVLILYGTVTGNSKRLSEELRKELKKVTDVAVFNIINIDAEELMLQYASLQDMCLFLLPTHDGGMPPQNMSFFYNWLHDAVNDFRYSKGAFKGLRYGVFGLGNSQYKSHYNKVGKQVDEVLSKLGADRVIPLTLGDEDSLQDDFKAWTESVVNYVTSGKPDLGLKHESQATQTEMVDTANNVLDLEELGPALLQMKQQSKTPQQPKEMITPALRTALTKQGYKLLGSHSGVKLCRWTKAMLRGRGGCYKHTFYGIESHRCMEATPSLACANKCVFCWRHHTNPVGTEWRWKTDDPHDILDQALAAHYNMINEFKGAPGVLPDRLAEGLEAKHCALSLVGEPIMYPEINTFIKLLHSKHISSFLVTNAQFPDAIRQLSPVTQLYVSVDASTKNSLKKIDRPLFSDFWERFLDSLKALSRKGQRTVYRLTLVKAWNVEELESYSQLVKLGKPDFIEIKGVTFCGGGENNTLTMQNVPYHEEVVTFSSKLTELLPDYALASEHEHSNCVLIANKKFLVDGEWWTWINYERFHKLVERLEKTGEPFTALDYIHPTPSWAVFGCDERGFDPVETRWHRRPATAGC